MPNRFLRPLQINYSPKSHIPGLDGLRGLAIVLVLLYHCFFPLWKVGANAGWVGVDLFFVLSGFLITGILLDSLGKKNYFSTFYLRRSLRIFPLYYFFLICFFLISPFVINPEELKPYQFYFDNQLWYWLYIPNWLITFDNHWPPVPKPLLDHFWSLAIEEQFYLFWPLMVFFFKRRTLIYICLFFILQSMVIRNLFEYSGKDYSSSYVFTFARLDAISIGALVALLIRGERGKLLLANSSRPIFVISFLILFILTLLSHNFSLKNEYFIRIGYTIIGIFFGSFLVLVLSEGSILGKICNTGFLKFFGKYSYGIYVYHWLISPLINDYFAYQVMRFTTISPWLIASFLSVFLIILISILSFHLFEKQNLKLKRFVNY